MVTAPRLPELQECFDNTVRHGVGLLGCPGQGQDGPWSPSHLWTFSDSMKWKPVHIMENIQIFTKPVPLFEWNSENLISIGCYSRSVWINEEISAFFCVHGWGRTTCLQLFGLSAGVPSPSDKNSECLFWLWGKKSSLDSPEVSSTMNN